MSENIWVAAADNKVDMVKKFFESGFNANSADPNGFTPIHAAASYGHVELLKYLLANGGNVNVQDSDGDTPLHHAESLDVVKLLINEYNADYRIKNNDGLNVKEYFIEEGEFPEIIHYFEILEKTGDHQSDELKGALNLPNGQEIKAFLHAENNDDENSPEMMERRRQVEAIFTNTELSESGRDDKLREYVMGVVSANMGKLKNGQDIEKENHKRRK